MLTTADGTGRSGKERGSLFCQPCRVKRGGGKRCVAQRSAQLCANCTFRDNQREGRAIATERRVRCVASVNKTVGLLFKIPENVCT